MHVNDFLQAEEPVGAPLPEQTHPLHRILVVEDDSAIRRLNAKVLMQSGFHVDAAEDGAMAWDALQTNTYKLLVTDNDMPKVTGMELLHKVHAARIQLPVIMATGTYPTEELTRFPWLKPAAILIKPYTAAQLLGTVQEILRASGPVA